MKAPSWEDLTFEEGSPDPAGPDRGDRDLPASYLTHELRAPVTAIRLGLELLREQVEGRLRPAERQMLDVAVKNTARLETLVDDIMDYSKIMAGKLAVLRAPCDPRRLVEESVDGLQALALSRGIKLIKAGGEPLPRVHAEGRRVIQILVNLISNALKFTPAQGMVTVNAELGRREHLGTVVFKVRDTGRGIRSKDLERVFHLFAQGRGEDASEGTGLGLTLARLMVGLHGGRIWAESWEGAGSSFYFTIPIAASDRLRPAEAYPAPVEYSGLLVSLARRLNAFLALFV